jgi:hypothetical protein
LTARQKKEKTTHGDDIITSHIIEVATSQGIKKAASETSEHIREKRNNVAKAQIKQWGILKVISVLSREFPSQIFC